MHCPISDPSSFLIPFPCPNSGQAPHPEEPSIPMSLNSPDLPHSQVAGSSCRSTSDITKEGLTSTEWLPYNSICESISPSHMPGNSAAEFPGVPHCTPGGHIVSPSSSRGLRRPSTFMTGNYGMNTSLEYVLTVASGRMATYTSKDNSTWMLLTEKSGQMKQIHMRLLGHRVYLPYKTMGSSGNVISNLDEHRVFFDTLMLK